jgi:hypothetical protein
VPSVNGGLQRPRDLHSVVGVNGVSSANDRRCGSGIDSGDVVPGVNGLPGIQGDQLVVVAPTGFEGSGDVLEPRPIVAAGTDQDATIRALAGKVEQRLTHVRDRVAPRALPAAIARAVQRLHDELGPARNAVCQGEEETHGRPGYRPPDALRRDILARHATCVFPTCNRDARRCDLDHTTPWRPGTTCHCNLAPLCRRHHRLKQTPGWTLHQIWPGLLVWTTPSGGWYVAHPDRE